MNERLIAEFIEDAARQPQGQRMTRLIELVAERCATIMEIEAETDLENAARNAANTIRACFIEQAKAPEGGFRLNPTASALRQH